MKERWHYWLVGYIATWALLLIGWFTGNTKWGYEPPKSMSELIADFTANSFYWLVIVLLSGVICGEILRIFVPQKK